MTNCTHNGPRHTDVCFDQTHWHGGRWSRVYREGDVLKCRGCDWVDEYEVASWRIQDQIYGAVGWLRS